MNIVPSLIEALVLIAVILVSLSVHEFAHAVVANLFGDDTAKHEGRMSLNPIKHWDPIGTSLLVGLIFLNAFGLRVPIFGWGKPVPVDEGNFENPRWHGLQTAIAGPLSNAILAVSIAYIGRVMGATGFAAELIQLAVYLNIFLMFFNLLPIPPLDGSRILRLFLPEETYYALATNPVVFYLLILGVLFFLVDPLQGASIRLTTFLLGG